MNKIKYLIMLLFCMGSLAAMGQNQVASGTVSDDLGPLMGVYVGEIGHEWSFYPESAKPEE